MSDLDKKLAEAEKNAVEARQKTELMQLKIRLFQMGLSLKTSDYEKYKNLEARIKEIEK